MARQRYIAPKDAPKTTHSGVEIVYNVEDNNWLFTLRGRDKHASTLKLAMDAIDAPPPKDKKPFDPFKAYYRQDTYSNDYEVVTVQSLAANVASYRGLEAWIRHEASKGVWRKRGDREKVGIDRLFAINAENDKLLAQLKDVDKEQEKLKKMEDDLNETMQPTHIRKTDYD